MEFPQKFNVLVTGTPGCGKTSLCQMLQDELGLIHIEVGKVIKEEKFYTEFDPAFDSYIIEQEDEDRLLDYLEPALVKGGCAVDYHGSDFFPRRWFGMVLTLRAKTEKIYDRLVARGYSEAKREENMDAEIMGVCEDEARRSYHESVLCTRVSNEVSDMLETIEVVRKWKNDWTPEKQEFATVADLDDDEDEDDKNADGCDSHDVYGGGNYHDDDYGGDDGHEKLRARLNNLSKEVQNSSSTNNNNNNNNNNGDNNNNNGNQQQQQEFVRMQQQMQQNTQMSKNNQNDFA